LDEGAITADAAFHGTMLVEPARASPTTSRTVAPIRSTANCTSVADVTDKHLRKQPTVVASKGRWNSADLAISPNGTKAPSRSADVVRIVVKERPLTARTSGHGEFSEKMSSTSTTAEGSKGRPSIWKMKFMDSIRSLTMTPVIRSWPSLLSERKETSRDSKAC
jgi:hypothetical protein